MSTVRFYLSLFLRRLPLFLLISTTISAVSFVVAFTLPPAYVSQMVLILEGPQIPDALAPSTVRTPGAERMQVIEKRLLTRANLLDIARRLNVLEDQNEMNPDEIVDAMRARTRVNMSVRRGEASIMNISFEARTARLAASVLNEYLSLIQASDASFRKGRAGQTLDFFEQEVMRLGAELEEQSARILKFKVENLGALPDSLRERERTRSERQQRLLEIEREIFSLTTQRQQLVAIFAETGKVVPGAAQNLSPEEKRLAAAEDELANALVVYSETNPRVRMLQAKVDQLRESLTSVVDSEDEEAQQPTGNGAFDFQLASIDTQVASLERQKGSLETSIAELEESIEKTANNSILLEELERDYENLLNQYNPAVRRLADADTGERIELLSRGERIAVIEQPALPSEPTKPNRIKIAGGGSILGIALGAGLVLALIFLNSAPRRPEDLIQKLEVWPIATLPYIRTRRELIIQRSIKFFLILLILVGAPLVVWALHTYYLPLDLIAEKVMNKLGVRW